MPFKFTGTLTKVEFKLGGDQLSPQKQAERDRLGRDIALRVQ
jgi:hypothetical protein